MAKIESDSESNYKKITILAKKKWVWKPLEKNIYDNILDFEFKIKKGTILVENDFYLKFTVFIKDNSLKEIEQIKIHIMEEKKSKFIRLNFYYNISLN